MTAEVRVRRLSPDEWATWRDLRLRALADSPDAFGRTYDEERAFADETWMTRVDDPLNRNLVATLDGMPVGIAGVRLNPDDPMQAWVFSMWVDSGARRRGVARALLGNALDAARELGAARARLTVTIGNDAAWDLYRSDGFEDSGERDALREGSDLQIAIMHKDLL